MIGVSPEVIEHHIARHRGVCPKGPAALVDEFLCSHKAVHLFTCACGEPLFAAIHQVNVCECVYTLQLSPSP